MHPNNRMGFYQFTYTFATATAPITYMHASHPFRQIRIMRKPRIHYLNGFHAVFTVYVNYVKFTHVSDVSLRDGVSFFAVRYVLKALQWVKAGNRVTFGLGVSHAHACICAII